MDVDQASAFGTLDYIFFAGMLVISLLIGVVASFKGNQSPEEFLMGNRSFGPIPIAMSLLTSIVSAISLLGFSGEAYAFGPQLYLFVIGILLGIVVSIYTTLPVIYPLKLTSVNEYIELRFNSAPLRQVVMAMTCINGVLYMGVCLYAPTIALATVTPLTSTQYIFILGAVVTIYSSIGGIRAVVWTDVFQLIVMFLGLAIIVAASLIDIGGFTKVWDISLAGGRLDMFNTNPSIYERHNIYNTIAFGLFLFASLYGVSQMNVQRLCSVRSIKDSYTILYLNAVGMIIIYTLIFGGGVIAYAIYAGCDPMERGLITKKEEIMPFLVIDRLNYITGLPGIFVATIIGGALSSLSSVMNAQVAMLWADVCIKLKIFRNIKPVTAGIVNKVLSAITGVIIIGTALIASTSNSLIQFSLSITGVTYGGVYGVFFLGLVFPKTSAKGAWVGLITSSLFVMFISAGAFIYSEHPVPLPVSTDNCPDVSFNTTDILTEETLTYETVKNTTIYHKTDFENFLMLFFDVSYTLYSVIGTSVCVIVGIITSYLTGNRDLKTLEPTLIAPFMRRFYWSNNELKMHEMEEKKLNEAENSISANGNGIIHFK